MALTAHTNLTSTASAATTGLRDIKPPMEIPTGWEWLWILLGVLIGLAILAGLIALIIHLIARNRRANVPAMIPAHERARRKLEAALDLFDQPKAFCTVVSDAVRLYLEERFGLRAPERTTDEFLADLGKSSALTQAQKESLQEFLSACDMVKFAKYEPQRPELETLYKSALRLIEETEPVEVPTGKAEAVSPHSR